MAQFDEYGRRINPNFQSQQVGNFEYHRTTTNNYNVWGVANDFITSIGDWFSENAESASNNLAVIFYYGSWVVLGISVIVGLFSSIFGAIMLAVIGGIITFYASAILFWVMYYFLLILFWIFRYVFYNLYVLLFCVLLILGISFSNTIQHKINRTPNTEIVEPVADSKKYVVTASSLNVRSGRGASYQTLGSLQRNRIVEVLEVQDNWGTIIYNGRTGYVSMEHLREVAD